jgi:hypothetical protein
LKRSYIKLGGKKCIIGLCGWPKLQITPCGINMNLEIPMIGFIYESILKSNSVKNVDGFFK